MDERWDCLLLDASIATMQGEHGYGLIEPGAIGWKDGRIVWVGEVDALPAPPGACAQRVEHVDGALITPGLVDCHTHLVFGGDRADEFEMRLNGISYEDIARAGGGIASTVRWTRAAGADELFGQSRPRLAALVQGGVTTVEIKSGYGLDFETEARMLRVARRLGEETGVTVRTTFLGLHALPPEYRDRRADYVDAVVAMLPRLVDEGLVDAVDAFCEGVGFAPEEVRQLFEAARAEGLALKLHADQLSDLDGAALAADYGALSADHLEYTSEAGVRAMALAGTVAVILPGAYYCLRETQPPPIAALRAQRVPMAVATDLNPGTSPVASLTLAMNLACTQFRITPEEALRGTTVHAARALGLTGRKGVLVAGADADLVVWDAESPADLCYWIGRPMARRVYAAGREIAYLA
jgi:imidazolonepropionase